MAAIRSLLGLTPKTARGIRAGGTEEEILLSPMIAAPAMSLGSVAGVFDALRLRNTGD